MEITTPALAACIVLMRLKSLFYFWLPRYWIREEEIELYVIAIREVRKWRNIWHIAF